MKLSCIDSIVHTFSEITLKTAEKPRILGEQSSFMRNVLAEKMPALKRYALLDSGSPIEEFFETGQPRIVSLYNLQEDRFERALVKHDRESYLTPEKLKNKLNISNDDFDTILMCHPETLADGLRCKHPFPDHVGEISIASFDKSWDHNTGFASKMYVPQLQGKYQVWEVFPGQIIE